MWFWFGLIFLIYICQVLNLSPKSQELYHFMLLQLYSACIKIIFNTSAQFPIKSISWNDNQSLEFNSQLEIIHIVQQGKNTTANAVTEIWGAYEGNKFPLAEETRQAHAIITGNVHLEHPIFLADTSLQTTW